MISILDHELVDLILLDVNMPLMSGLETCLELKKNDRTKHIPIIFLTALNRKEDILEGLKAGGTDYVTKPFSHDELLLRVNTQLQLIEALEEKGNIEIKYIKKEEARKRLASNLDLAGTLIDGLSHEFFNPLNVTISSLEIMKELMAEFQEGLKKEQRSETKEFFDDITASVDCCLTSSWRIYNIVRSVERIQLPKSEEREEVDLLKSIKNGYQWAHQKQFSGQQTPHLLFELDTCGEEFSIYADPKSIDRLFQNIFHNAFDAICEKFSQENLQGLVKVSLAFSEDEVLVKIQDNGKGISPENLEKIFNPFFSTKPPGKGLGLGLTIASNIVLNQNDGTIGIESTENESTVVKISLPRTKQVK